MKRIIIIGTEPLIIIEIPYIMLFLHAPPAQPVAASKKVCANRWPLPSSPWQLVRAGELTQYPDAMKMHPCSPSRF